MPTTPRREPCPFAMLVYQLLVVEKRATIEEVARKMGLSYAAFHSRLANRTRFQPSEVRRLVEIVEEVRLVRFFSEHSRFVVAERPAATHDDGASIRIAVARAVREAIDVMQVAVASLESGTSVDHRERALILREVGEAEGAMAALRLALERAASAPS